MAKPHFCTIGEAQAEARRIQHIAAQQIGWPTSHTAHEPGLTTKAANEATPTQLKQPITLGAALQLAETMGRTVAALRRRVEALEGAQR